MNEKFLYQNKVLVSRRKELRNNATPAEQILWDYLRGRGLGCKFTRQYSVGPYILDFYCPKLRLAIELDGNQHRKGEVILYDKDRTKYLEGANIRIMRFWNRELIKNPKAVVHKIYKQITNLGTPS